MGLKTWIIFNLYKWEMNSEKCHYGYVYSSIVRKVRILVKFSLYLIGMWIHRNNIEWIKKSLGPRSNSNPIPRGFAPRAWIGIEPEPLGFFNPFNIVSMDPSNTIPLFE